MLHVQPDLLAGCSFWESSCRLDKILPNAYLTVVRRVIRRSSRWEYPWWSRLRGQCTWESTGIAEWRRTTLDAIAKDGAVKRGDMYVYVCMCVCVCVMSIVVPGGWKYKSSGSEAAGAEMTLEKLALQC